MGEAWEPVLASWEPTAVETSVALFFRATLVLGLREGRPRGARLQGQVLFPFTPKVSTYICFTL